jgi:hypothetical protein
VKIANHTELKSLATRWANKMYSFLWLDKLADAASEAARDTLVDDCCELDFVRRGHGGALKLNFVGFDIVYFEKKVRNAFVKTNTILDLAPLTSFLIRGSCPGSMRSKLQVASVIQRKVTRRS